MKIEQVILLFVSGFTAACSVSPLNQGYVAAQGIAGQVSRNPNPRVVRVTPTSHEVTVAQYTESGYSPIGFAQTWFKYEVDIQMARLFGVEKKADVVIFSVQDIGYHKNSVPSENSQMVSGGDAFKLYEHKTTLLNEP
jgi:hypothetical protein